MTTKGRVAAPTITLIATISFAPPQTAAQAPADVPPAVWVESLQALGEATPHPAWDIFVGGCPRDEAWRAAARDALLQASFDPARRFVLARMVAGGMDRCGDTPTLEWMITQLRELSRYDELMLLPSYLHLLRTSQAVREHPVLRELMADTTLSDWVRSRFAFTIEHEMAPSEREDFLVASLRSGTVPTEWGNAAVIGLLRDRGEAFVARLSTELAADPGNIWDNTVMQTVASNLRHEQLFPVSRERRQELATVLARVARDSRLPSQDRRTANRLSRLIQAN